MNIPGCRLRVEGYWLLACFSQGIQNTECRLQSEGKS